jgi:hypothetical protein
MFLAVLTGPFVEIGLEGIIRENIDGAHASHITIRHGSVIS